MRTKTDLLVDLRVMLRDVFAAKASGMAYPRVARAHGYVDGSMRALLEAELVSRHELLEVVASERERAMGPAMHEIVDPSLDARMPGETGAAA
jgi:hypothetical protein